MHKLLKDFIFEELVQVDNIESFTDQDDLLDAGLDSMGIMRLILFIEEELGVSLPDDEIEPDNLQSIDCITQWIERHK